MLNWNKPRISVIIATYNWSAALKLSIQSAQQQSIKNIEIVVVGDGCTDDSEMIVNNIKDKRVRWLGLRHNSGSLGEPHNRGIEVARADLIAYLGHDDIWHPQHLEWLLNTLKQTDADYVYSGAILYGPSDTNMRMLTGFPIGQSKKIHFTIPVTTVLHKKELLEQIGEWKSNIDSTYPIDYEFQQRALAAGAKFADTGKVSAFKFPAAWQRDSFKKKDVSRQSALLNKICKQPDFLADELLAVAKAAEHGLLVQTQLPEELEKGEFFAINARMKGVSHEFQIAAPTVEQVNYLLYDDCHGYEWHGLEFDSNGLPFRWSGPRLESTLTIPISTENNIEIQIHLLQAITPDIFEQLILLVNDEPTQFTIEKDVKVGYQLKALVSRQVAATLTKNLLKLTFKLPRTVAPLEFERKGSRKLVGLAVHKVKCKLVA